MNATTRWLLFLGIALMPLIWIIKDNKQSKLRQKSHTNVLDTSNIARPLNTHNLDIDSSFLSANLPAASSGYQYSAQSLSLCKDYTKYGQLSNLQCQNKTIYDRLKLALIMENCGAVLRSAYNGRMVASKLRKLAAYDQFVFFRGAAGLFDYNMMCSDERETQISQRSLKKEGIPTVLSNGDCHPENFGVMVMANDKLIWGVNDFDQGFNSPFTWDLKRGATGFLIGCMSGGYDVHFCIDIVASFLKSYLELFSIYPQCVIPNSDTFLEGSPQSKNFDVVNSLFADARKKDSKKKTKKWFKKKGVDVKKERFFETDKLFPISNRDEMIPKFQKAVEEYLFHGTAAAAKFPNVNGFFDVKDVAEKMGSGTGSIGLNRFYILIKGRREEYGNIILEMKEQSRSVLENFFSYFVPADQEAKRAVDSETAAFPYANVFYGWTRFEGHPYIIREKSKHQTSVDLTELYEEPDANSPYNFRFYEFLNISDPHTTPSETSISHKDLAAKVYKKYLSQKLWNLENGSSKPTGKQAQFLEYARASGKALGFYHIRARCASVECALDELAFVDVETCNKIQMYLNSLQTEGESLEKEAIEFAIAETMREEHSWRLLKQVVAKMDSQHRSVLELLVS